MTSKRPPLVLTASHATGTAHYFDKAVFTMSVAARQASAGPNIVLSSTTSGSFSTMASSKSSLNCLSSMSASTQCLGPTGSRYVNYPVSVVIITKGTWKGPNGWENAVFCLNETNVGIRVYEANGMLAEADRYHFLT